MGERNRKEKLVEEDDPVRDMAGLDIGMCGTRMRRT
jgi:hypothetical protein